MKKQQKTLAMLVIGMLTAVVMTVVSAADAPGLPPPTDDIKDAFEHRNIFHPMPVVIFQPGFSGAIPTCTRGCRWTPVLSVHG